jgi:tetratricopeptide (TPR) repeat protein
MNDNLKKELEEEQKEELIFSLHNRHIPTVVFININTGKKRVELINFLKQNLKEYRFYNIDFTAENLESLYSELNHKLPIEVINSKPASYIVNVTGLENSILTTKEGKIIHSDLLSQLNFERELLFHKLPFIIIIWADKYFFNSLRKQAPDFCHWVTYSFKFEDDRLKDEKENQIKLSNQLLITENKGFNPKLELLESQYLQLNYNNSDTHRLIKDKIRLLKQIADEYLLIKKYDEAFLNYSNALGLAKKINAGNFMLADILVKRGLVSVNLKKFDLALQDLKTILEFEDDDSKKYYPETYFYASVAKEELGEKYEALAFLEQALYWNEKTNYPIAMDQLYAAIGIIYQGLNKGEEALMNYKKSLEIAPNNAEVYYNLGVLYSFEFNDPRSAKASYEKSIELNPNDYRTYVNLGLIYEANFNDLVSAELNYNKALELNNHEAGIQNNLALLYLKQQKFDKAKQHFENAIEIDNNYIDAILSLSTLVITELEDFEYGLHLMQNVLKIDPNNYNVLNNLGILYQDHFQDYETSKTYFEKAIEVNPKIADAHYNLAYLLQTHFKKNIEAKIHYEMAIKLLPNYFNAHYNLAILLHNEFKDFEYAKNEYLEAIKIKYDHSQAHNNLGVLYFNEFKDFEKAKFHLQKAIEFDNTLGQAYYNLANYFISKENDIEKGKGNYLAAIKLDPTLIDKKLEEQMSLNN